MAWSDFIKNFRVPNVTVIENKNSDYDTEKVGTIQIPDSLTDTNAYNLAQTVAELYFPIDFLADRASKLRFYISDKSGNEIVRPDVTRFITNINPLYTFSELVYQAITSLLADGNLFIYQNVPSIYQKVNTNTISRIDVLNPSLLAISEYSNISSLDVSGLTDFIKKAEYYEGTKRKELEKDKLFIFRYDSQRRDYSSVLCKSPLFKAYRSVNNLLATYSARYNVYANNGAAGYLSKKSNPKNEIEEALNPADREAILKDINNRNGITGNRHLWGISSVPIEFVNTLANIKDLMPFEETLEDTIKIAATFQINSNLVPRQDQSTYDNQAESERSVWENTLISLVDTVLSYFTKAAMFTDGLQIKADYATVSALNENETAKEDLISKKLDNITKAKGLNPEFDTITQINQIYGIE